MEKIASAGRDADCAEFLLFRTGWDKRWGSSEYFGDYPSLTAEAADYLIKSGKKGVGLDVIGIDPIADANLTIHKQLFKESEIVVIENLKNLDLVGSGLLPFCALPMKYHNADGAPMGLLMPSWGLESCRCHQKVWVKELLKAVKNHERTFFGNADGDSPSPFTASEFSP